MKFPPMKVVESPPTAAVFCTHEIGAWLGKGWGHSENMEIPRDGLGFTPHLNLLLT